MLCRLDFNEYYISREAEIEEEEIKNQNLQDLGSYGGESDEDVDYGSDDDDEYSDDDADMESF